MSWVLQWKQNGILWIIKGIIFPLITIFQIGEDSFFLFFFFGLFLFSVYEMKKWSLMLAPKAPIYYIYVCVVLKRAFDPLEQNERCTRNYSTERCHSGDGEYWLPKASSFFGTTAFLLFVLSVCTSQRRFCGNSRHSLFEDRHQRTELAKGIFSIYIKKETHSSFYINLFS